MSQEIKQITTKPGIVAPVKCVSFRRSNAAPGVVTKFYLSNYSFVIADAMNENYRRNNISLSALLLQAEFIYII